MFYLDNVGDYNAIEWIAVVAVGIRRGELPQSVCLSLHYTLFAIVEGKIGRDGVCSWRATTALASASAAAATTTDGTEA